MIRKNVALPHSVPLGLWKARELQALWKCLVLSLRPQTIEQFITNVRRHQSTFNGDYLKCVKCKGLIGSTIYLSLSLDLFVHIYSRYDCLPDSQACVCVPDQCHCVRFSSSATHEFPFANPRPWRRRRNPSDAASASVCSISPGVIWLPGRSLMIPVAYLTGWLPSVDSALARFCPLAPRG